MTWGGAHRQHTLSMQVARHWPNPYPAKSYTSSVACSVISCTSRGIFAIHGLSGLGLSVVEGRGDRDHPVTSEHRRPFPVTCNWLLGTTLSEFYCCLFRITRRWVHPLFSLFNAFVQSKIINGEINAWNEKET